MTDRSDTDPNTEISARIRQLHAAVLDIVGVMNSPHQDERMVRDAGIALDRALFPLLVGIARTGPVGVMDLAVRVGRDHSTVSRQVGRLDQLGLVERCAHPTDRRMRQARVTPRGRAMTDRVDIARDQMGRRILTTWDPGDVDALVRLMRRLADDLKAYDAIPANIHHEGS